MYCNVQLNGARRRPMKALSEPEISRALGPLRDVVRSLAQAALGEVPTGTERQKMVRKVRSAGPSALPTLVRALGSAREPEATWAYFLLSRLGGERTVGRLGALLQDREVPDEIKARALGLLS